MMRRPRIRVVAIGGAAGVLAVMFVFSLYVLLRSPARAYDAGFDARLTLTQPGAAPIVLADPALRSLMSRQTGFAYQQGGWPMATRMFHQIEGSEITAYAGDGPILACNGAWRNVLRSLEATPQACRAFVERRFDEPGLRASMAPATVICNAATIDGGQRRLSLAAPIVSGDAEYRSVTSRLADAGDTVVLEDPASDDLAVCQAALHRYDREAALPPDLMARYLRTGYRNGAHENVVPPPEAPAGDPPEHLCAPAGTMLTLSIIGRDGLPITFRSLGQKGWNCPITSSATGPRELWGSEQESPLRLMWPLAVGNTARVVVARGDGTAKTTTWRITGRAPYWTPWGEVDAFAIDEDVIEGDTLHYVVTAYWSPELGFKIGQRRRAILGTLPDWLAPDWQLVARDAPVGRGAILSRQAAAADIRIALSRAEAIHPDLFWYVDRGAVLARADAAVAALPDPATAMDVYVALSGVLGVLGDGHVSLSHPADQRGSLLRSYRRAGGSLLMVDVRPVASGLKVVWCHTDGVGVGDVLATINGRDAKAVFASAAGLAGGEPAFQQLNTQTEFPARLWDLDIQAPFVLDGVFDGRRDLKRVAGWTDTRLAAAPPTTNDEGLRLKELPDRVWLLEFYRMTAPVSAFDQRLATLFGQLAQAKARGLIVDIRNNGGGNTRLGDDLLWYLSGKPRRPFARKTVRASAECRAYYGDSGDFDGMNDGETHVWNVPMQLPRANALRFKGPVAVLIGPGTFSAANVLANTIGDFGLATLIGQDTAEIPNNFGNACPVALPNTGMELRVPSAYLVRANGDQGNGEDVHPNIKVPRAPEEGPTEDVDLEAARHWISEARY